MPLPLAPIALFAVRTGVVAAVVWAVRRSLTPGRTDQRAEDALDDTAEGIALHRPADRAVDGARQTNATLRFRRSLRWRDTGVEIDAGLLGRLRIRKL